MTNKNSPCYECICAPICQSKDYVVLIECSLIFDYIYRNKDERAKYYDATIEQIKEDLNPNRWE